MRLNRYLSVCGVSSRRKGETIIAEGHVSVNGIIVTDPAQNIDPDNDFVMLDGKSLTITAEKKYFVLNKPTGVIVSKGDTHNRATVYDLIGSELLSVFPVGRLDMNTSGVLLLTDDGDLAYRLMHPSFEIDKVYRAEVTGKVTEHDIGKFREGIMLEDGLTAPAEMKILASDANSSLVEVTLHQGRKRQVRRMLEQIGHPVRTLERISFGGITAQGLPTGSYRALTADEIKKVKP